MEGAVLGSYRIVRKLGEGGMGVVWLAEHTLLGRPAAVKVLHPSFSRQPQVVKRFFNEARAATAVADPGIVQIFDFGHHTDGSAYLVMEYLEGETLDSRLRRLGVLRLGDALRIIKQVATSLAAAHARGIIHRDLKPENIVLAHDPEVVGFERTKILDFGIAKLVTDGTTRLKTQTAVVMGTPRYMSPEQCRGAGYVDHRSDVYALGCVLFHLAVGSPPFDGEGPGDVIAMHLREPPPVPSTRAPGLPPELDALLLRCLAKVPDERFPSMLELVKALGAVQAQLGPTESSGPHAQWNGAPTLAITPSTFDSTPPPWTDRRGRRPSTLSSGASPVTVAQTSPRGRRRGLIAVSMVVAASTAGAIALLQRGDREVPASTSEPAEVLPAVVSVDAAGPVDAGIADAMRPAPAAPPDAAPAPSRPPREPKQRPPRRPPRPPTDPCDVNNDGVPDTRC